MIINSINKINYIINVYLYTSKTPVSLMRMKINCDDEDWNPSFFQRASTKEPVGVTLKNRSDA